jgi:HAD superfamily hydrolase (TIGR01662 family)
MALILCDLDDTILRRHDEFVQWAEAYVRDYALPKTEIDWFVEVDQDGYRPRQEFFTMVADRHDLVQTPEQVAQRYLTGFPRSFRCPPDAVEALTRARRRGFKVAIVTNGERRAQETKLAAARLFQLVDAVCISEIEGCAKPDRQIFERAAHRCRTDLRDAWMVGDHPINDIEGARACGVRSIWIPNGRCWPSELSFSPDAKAETFAEAIDLVLSS